VLDGQSRFSIHEGAALCEFGDAMEVGVVTVDCASVITGWNRWMETVTGTRAVDAMGKPLLAVYPELRPAAQGAFEQAIGGATVILSHRLHGYLFDIPLTPPVAGFTRMQQSVRLLPLFRDTDQLAGALALVQDVTDRVAREAELRQALGAAQQADRDKSDFLTAMSHELRTPIGAISAYADLLKDGIFGPVSPTQQEHLVRIKTVSGHLLGIVEEILTFARLEARREQVRVAAADAVQIVREALLVVEPLCEQKGLQFRHELPPSPVMVHTDEAKVRQIVINLLGNAVKFTERGEISTLMEATDEKFVIAIRDTGSGIAPEDLSRIFEPFVQVGLASKASTHGTGLGLSVSRVLARLLGGDLTVESTAGAGSVFIATLPRQLQA
jgi:signal transduction histidine kinase